MASHTAQAQRAWRWPAAAAVLLALLGSPAAVAQEAPAAPPAPPHRRIDIEFSGGNAEALVEQIRKQIENGPNIVITDNAKGVPVDAFTLTQVEPVTAVKVMEWMTGGRLRILILNGDRTGLAEVVVIDNSDPTYRRPSPRRSVYTIRDLLARSDQDLELKYKAEQVLSVIEETLKLGGSDPNFRMLLHPDTGLLILSGDARDIQTVESVIEELRKGIAMARQEKGQPGPTESPLVPEPEDASPARR